MGKIIPNNFQPEYIERKWTIRHDITGSVIVREINVKQNDWIKYLIWDQMVYQIVIRHLY